MDLLELAVKIAGKVIGAELEAKPQLLVGLIRSALESGAQRARDAQVASKRPWDLDAAWPQVWVVCPPVFRFNSPLMSRSTEVV